MLDHYGKGNQFGFGGVDVQTELGGQPWSMGRSMNRRSRGPIWLIWFVGFFFFFFGSGWLVFFPIFLAMVGGDLVQLLLIFFLVQWWMWLWWIWLVASGGNGGWMWYGWVDAVASDAKNNWVE